jgi:hypothetical protein
MKNYYFLGIFYHKNNNNIRDFFLKKNKFLKKIHIFFFHFTTFSFGESLAYELDIYQETNEMKPHLTSLLGTI